MQLHKLFGRHVVCPLKNLACPLIGVANLALFFIGKRHDAKRKYLVDLRAVEQVSGALRGDLRAVVKNDGGSQERVALIGVSHQHRPNTDVLTLASYFLESWWWFEQGEKLAATCPQNCVHGDEGVHQRAISSRIARSNRRGVANIKRYFDQVLANRLRDDLDLSPNFRLAANNFA